MSRIITGDNEEVRAFFAAITSLMPLLEEALSNHRPILNGERYLTDAELAKRLKLSRRTLQEYRSNGTVSYYQLGGKVLYRESDIEHLLKENRREAFR